MLTKIFPAAFSTMVGMVVLQVITGVFIDLILDVIMLGIIYWLHHNNQA